MKKFLTVMMLCLVGTVWAEEDNYVVVRDADEEIKIYDPVQMKRLSAGVVMIFEDGSKKVVQGSNLLGEVPKIPKTVNRETVQKLLAVYREFFAKSPGAAKLLEEPYEALKKAEANILEKEAKAEAEREAKEDERVASFVSGKVFNASTSYRQKEIESLVSNGRNLMTQVPRKAEEIGKYLQPWLEELQNLKKGNLKVGGKWVTAAEFEARKKEEEKKAMVAFFDKEKPFKLSPIVLSGDTTLWVLIIGGAGLLITLILIGFGAKELWRGFSFFGAAPVAVGVLLLPIYFYYGFGFTSSPGDTSSFEAPSGEQATSLSEGLLLKIHPLMVIPEDDAEPELPKMLDISDKELNAFIATDLEMKDIESGGLDVVRKSTVIRVEPQVISVFEKVNFMGMDLFLTHRIFYKVEKDGFSFYRAEVDLGSVGVPNRIAAIAWQDLQKDLLSWVQKSQVLGFYYLNRINAGKFELRLLKKMGAATGKKSNDGTK